jgi:hypothetical protein
VRSYQLLGMHFSELKGSNTLRARMTLPTNVLNINIIFNLLKIITKNYNLCYTIKKININIFKYIRIILYNVVISKFIGEKDVRNNWNIDEKR